MGSCAGRPDDGGFQYHSRSRSVRDESIVQLGFILAWVFPATVWTQTFSYEPPPPRGQPIPQTYQVSSSQTTTAGEGSSDTYQVAFSTEQKSSGGFLAFISVDLKNSNTTTWVNKTSTTANTQGTVTAQLSITGPATTDNYAGPTEMQVWKDNVYGSFMFFPVQ